jgi:cellulose biosynthesis protein BcsQ
MTDIDTDIFHKGKQVPVVAFMGTKGGTGKTTIARTFVELVAQAPSQPNVLLVDADVFHRGMTSDISKDTPVTCKSLHDYISKKDPSGVEAAYMSGEIRDAYGSPGDLYFIPASYPDSSEVFQRSAQLGASEMLRILHAVVAAAVQKYECQCVVIDCGAIPDPYTAAAVMLADRAFIVATNDETSFQNLSNYPRQIRDFYPHFNVAKMRTIFNRVRQHDLLEQRKLHTQQNVYASVPFQNAVMDGMEGVAGAERLARIFLRKHVGDIVKRIFHGDHEELIPDSRAMVPPEWFPVLENAGTILNKIEKRLSMSSLFLGLCIVLLVGSAGFLYHASRERHSSERMHDAKALIAVLKGEIALCTDDGRALRLRDALKLAEAVGPHDRAGLKDAATAAARTGIVDLPQGARLPRTNENLAIAATILLFALASSGLAKRRQYLASRRLLKKVEKDAGTSILEMLEQSRDDRRAFAVCQRMLG